MSVRRERTRSAARYLLVGMLSYGIDVGVLSLCWRVLSAPLWLSTSAGFWCSFAANFGLSRHWTFGQGRHRPGPQLLRFSILVAVNYVITVVGVTLLHHAGAGVIAARTIVLGVSTVWTYLLYRRWVFAPADGNDD